MRMGILLGLLVMACGPGSERRTDSNVVPTPCSGFGCPVVQCDRMGLPPTTVSGTVFAPNGTLALYGAMVYVPVEEPGPFPEGVQCSQCMDQLPGGAVAHVQSDTAGKFELKNVPSGSDIPLVVTIGKWRRKVVIPSIQQCTDNPLPSGLTSLPKNKMEGDIPRIAVTTGSFDALECLLRKVGVADSEFTADSGTGRVHLYAGYGGADSIGNSTATVSPASALWGNVDKMKQYDMMLFSCEGAQHPEEKPQAYMNNVKQYADLGGRLFMSHYHSIWIDGDTEMPAHAPPVWPEIATCDVQNNPTTTGVIDEINNPKGSAFSKWMMNVMGSAIAGTIAINESRQSCSAIDNTRAERWVYMKSNGSDFPQTFQFTTPNEVPKEQRCGKVVFSDMHVASGSTSSAGTPFPQGCAVTEMSPQEKALAFMLFDIATCVGPIL